MKKITNQELNELIDGFKNFKIAAHKRIKDLDADRFIMKNNQKIKDFLALKKADILALSAQEREILIFRVAN